MAIDDRSPVIRASEIGQYVYCTRAWWFARVKGYRSANIAALRQGTELHHAHGRSVVSYHRLRQMAVVLILLATLLLAVWLLASLGR